jgi:predicted aconitase
MRLRLEDYDLSVLNGEHGDGAKVAMSILTEFSDAIGAEHLLDISGAHVDGCLYHGQVSLDFVERLVAGGGVRVPTTLNVASWSVRNALTVSPSSMVCLRHATKTS